MFRITAELGVNVCWDDGRFLDGVHFELPA